MRPARHNRRRRVLSVESDKEPRPLRAALFRRSHSLARSIYEY